MDVKPVNERHKLTRGSTPRLRLTAPAPITQAEVGWVGIRLHKHIWFSARSIAVPSAPVTSNRPPPGGKVLAVYPGLGQAVLKKRFNNT